MLIELDQTQSHATKVESVVSKFVYLVHALGFIGFTLAGLCI